MNDLLNDFEVRDQAIASGERALIATVTAYSDQMQHADDLLPQDFAFPSHQSMWAEILALHRVDQLSPQAVVQALSGKNQLFDLGHEFGPTMGATYINELLTYAAPQSTKFFAKGVLDQATRRGIRRAAALLAADADRSDISPEELLDKTESDLVALRRSRGVEGQAIGTLLDLFETTTDKRRDGTFIPALAPHIVPIKSIVKFYEGQDFIIIAARPGEGKSSVMRYEAFQEAMEGRMATIFNLENGELEYARNLVAMQTGIDNEELRNPSLLDDDQMQRVKDAIRTLKGIPLTIVTMGAPSVDEVTRVMVDAIRRGSKSLWLDYVQLINNRLSSAYENVSVSSTRLRGVSMKHHVPLVTAAQLSRDIVKRGSSAEPELADLRDSGSLEQDATTVIFLRLSWGPNPTERDLAQFPENGDGVIRVAPLRAYVRKNRNGPVGVTNPFKWDRSVNTFEAL